MSSKGYPYACGQPGIVLKRRWKTPMFSWKTLEDTPGRRARRSRFGLEDVNLFNKKKNNIYFTLSICVFQGILWEVCTSSKGVFQGLPGKQRHFRDPPARPPARPPVSVTPLGGETHELLGGLHTLSAAV